MPTSDLDKPDITLGRQDPFVHAVRVWTSLESMRRHGWPEQYTRNVARSMDAVMVRHRRILVAQFMAADPTVHRDHGALLRRMGLEYWEDGQILAENDPGGDDHVHCTGSGH